MADLGSQIRMKHYSSEIKRKQYLVLEDGSRMRVRAGGKKPLRALIECAMQEKSPPGVWIRQASPVGRSEGFFVDDGVLEHHVVSKKRARKAIGKRSAKAVERDPRGTMVHVYDLEDEGLSYLWYPLERLEMRLRLMERS